MKIIRCKVCGKVLMEAEYGHFKKKCPKCKKINEYIISIEK